MDIRSFLMGIAFVFMWSSAFTSARIIVAYAPPMTSLSFRFLISGLIGIAVAYVLGQSARLTRKQWISVVVFGVCQNAIYLGVNFVAMQTIEASLASIIASSLPLLVGLIGWLVFREKINPLGILGLIAGFSGVGIIMGARLQGGVDVYGVVLCMIGALSLAIATLAVRGASSGGNILMIVGLQMLVGSAMLAIPAAAFETFEIIWSWQLVAAFIYTTLVPGLIATVTWFYLVGRIGAVNASTYHFLNPFFGVAVASLLLGEQLGVTDIVGVIIIMGAILTVNLSKKPTVK